jgi:nucleotide-binding universal stress UspA family protein
MIKDVMVTLDGGPGDDKRLDAVQAIAQLFQSHVIGLFLNTVPAVVSVHDEFGAVHAPDLLEAARNLGDQLETRLAERLGRLNLPAEVRRIDVFAEDIANIASRESRSTDTFVALRPNGAMHDSERLIESVLFGSGRHLLLVPSEGKLAAPFNRVFVAWNGSREAARALTEAMPYLHEASEVIIAVIDDEEPVEGQALLGSEAVVHLGHHGIEASLHRTKANGGEIGAKLLDEAERLQADLIVAGGYGHSRLREYLLGGVTRDLLHRASMPLVLAH